MVKNPIGAVLFKDTMDVHSGRANGIIHGTQMLITNYLYAKQIIFSRFLYEIETH